MRRRVDAFQFPKQRVESVQSQRIGRVALRSRGLLVDFHEHGIDTCRDARRVGWQVAGIGHTIHLWAPIDGRGAARTPARQVGAGTGAMSERGTGSGPHERDLDGDESARHRDAGDFAPIPPATRPIAPYDPYRPRASDAPRLPTRNVAADS